MVNCAATLNFRWWTEPYRLFWQNPSNLGMQPFLLLGGHVHAGACTGESASYNIQKWRDIINAIHNSNQSVIYEGVRFDKMLKLFYVAYKFCPIDVIDVIGPETVPFEHLCMLRAGVTETNIMLTIVHSYAVYIKKRKAKMLAAMRAFEIIVATFPRFFSVETDGIKEILDSVFGKRYMKHEFGKAIIDFQRVTSLRVLCISFIRHRLVRVQRDLSLYVKLDKLRPILPSTLMQDLHWDGLFNGEWAAKNYQNSSDYIAHK